MVRRVAALEGEEMVSVKDEEPPFSLPQGVGSLLQSAQLLRVYAAHLCYARSI